MHSQETIQALIEARFASLRQASEQRNVDALMSWHAKDAVFTDVVNNISHNGIDAIRAFYTQAYAAMPTFRITTEPKQATGFTPEFATAEMRCEGEIAIDLPPHHPAGLTKAGETLHMVGVSLFWWRWEGHQGEEGHEGKGEGEGEGGAEEWDGSLSDEAVRGWKIVRERAYYNFTNKKRSQ